MIVPQFWAEARRQQTRAAGRRQITVRRFGWSDQSQADAQLKADHRAQTAFDQIISGEQLPLRERKIAYNGAQGVPIREEVLQRSQDTVITRNSYGAQCLNTPDVVFADIDFNEPVRGRTLFRTGAIFLLGALIIAGWLKSVPVALAGMLTVAVLTYPLVSFFSKIATALRGGSERWARARVRAFAARHPDWHLRIYRTPGGLRVLVMHDTFDPLSAPVAEFFQALRVDPIYATMCRNQHCFRARVSPKPWRICIARHLKPHPGVWPVKPEHLARRAEWVAAYETRAMQFASCRFDEALGATASVHAKAEGVREFHDRLSQALSGRDIA